MALLSQDVAIVSEKFTGQHSSGITFKNVTVFFLLFACGL